MTDTGYIPPQATDLEAAILGAILLEERGAYIGLKMMAPHYFYSTKHRDIFQSCLNLQADNKPIDLLTVWEEIKAMKLQDTIGGVSYLSGLTDRVASTANLEHHCRLVQERWLAREIISISTATIRESYKDGVDCFDTVNHLITKLHDSTRQITGANSKDLPGVLDELTEKIHGNREGVLPGVSTGVPKYDSVTGGQQDGNLIIYAARPGMGKTARLCNEAYHQLKNGKAVVIHSLEMTEVEVVARILALEIDIEPSRLLKRKLDDSELLQYEKARGWLSRQRLTILVDRRLKNIQIETSILKSTRGCDIAYIDYLQLIDAGHHKKIDNVSRASEGLKEMAKTVGIPVVALAQLSRAVESRGGDKKPQLSDLRESGQIEQDADVVEFIYRPEYYDIMMDEDGNSTAGQAHYINAKMRGGESGITVIMNWDGPKNRFSPIVSELPPLAPLPNNDDFDNFRAITMQSRDDDAPF